MLDHNIIQMIICENNSYTKLNEIASNLSFDLFSKIGREKLKKSPVVVLMSRDECAIASVLRVWKAGKMQKSISILMPGKLNIKMDEFKVIKWMNSRLAFFSGLLSPLQMFLWVIL